MLLEIVLLLLGIAPNGDAAVDYEPTAVATTVESFDDLKDDPRLDDATRMWLHRLDRERDRAKAVATLRHELDLHIEQRQEEERQERQEQEERERQAAAVTSSGFDTTNSPYATIGANGELRLQGAARIIADCESGDRLASGRAAEGSYDWLNRNGQGSSAAGAFQFIRSTWIWVAHDELGYTQYPEALDAPPHVQLEAFEWLWDNGRGKRHWAPSQSCWGGLL